VFTSYQRDSETGLDYALARYYDSRIGTFCSADPLAGSPDDPQSWNRYPYGRNDPIMMTDPNGKFAFLFIPILEALLPELEAAAAQLAPVVTTITVTATASAIPEIVAGSLAGGGIAGAALSQAPFSPRDMARFNKAQNQAQKNADKKDCNDFVQKQGIDPAGLKKAIANIQPWNGAKSAISQISIFTNRSERGRVRNLT